jgi:hypothetical protein
MSGYSAYTGVTGATGMSGMSGTSQQCLLSIEEFDESVEVRRLWCLGGASTFLCGCGGSVGVAVRLC